VISKVCGTNIQVCRSDVEWLQAEQSTQVAMQALDITTLAFACWQLANDELKWLISAPRRTGTVSQKNIFFNSLVTRGNNHDFMTLERMA
jgi:hypothetical protein